MTSQLQFHLEKCLFKEGRVTSRIQNTGDVITAIQLREWAEIRFRLELEVVRPNWPPRCSRHNRCNVSGSWGAWPTEDDVFQSSSKRMASKWRSEVNFVTYLLIVAKSWTVLLLKLFILFFKTVLLFVTTMNKSCWQIDTRKMRKPLIIFIPPMTLRNIWKGNIKKCSILNLFSLWRCYNISSYVRGIYFPLIHNGGGMYLFW